MFVWRKIGPTRRVTLQSKRFNSAKPGHLSSRANVMFPRTRFANFCKEMDEKLVGPG